LYTSGAFAVGSVLYQDSALTTPQLGFSFVVYNNIIYNVNSTTGAVTSSTGLGCTGLVTVSVNSINGTITSVSGISGYVFSGPISLGESDNGTHSAFSGPITVDVNIGASTGPIVLQVNGVTVESIFMSGDGTYGFSSRSYNSSDNIYIFM
jgi:hypothetical protein